MTGLPRVRNQHIGRSQGVFEHGEITQRNLPMDQLGLKMTPS
jgi:hypothetical protein